MDDRHDIHGTRYSCCPYKLQAFHAIYNYALKMPYDIALQSVTLAYNTCYRLMKNATVLV